MAKNNVLQETQNVLEIMNESEEKMSLLHDDLNQNQILCQRLKENVNKLKKFKIKSTAELEDNQRLKGNFKNCNQQILSFAQQIYLCNQELYSDLNLHDADLIKNEELLNKSNSLFEKKLNEYKSTHKTLLRELASTENERKKYIDAVAEIEKLQAELNAIDENRNRCENYITKNLTILENEKSTMKHVEELPENIQIAENEVNDLSKSMEDIKLFGIKLKQDGEMNILQLDKKCEEHEIKIKEKITESVEKQEYIDEISCKKEALEASIKDKAEEYANYENELNIMEREVKNIEEEDNKIINCCKKILSENEEVYKQQEELKAQLKLDICVFEEKNKSQEEYAKKIMEFLEEHKIPDIDLKTELEIREERRKELKIAYQQLKENYDEQVLEHKAEIKRIGEEIEAREKLNKKLQDDTESLLLELNQIKKDKEQKLMNQEWQIKQIAKLDSQIQDLIKVKERKVQSKNKGVFKVGSHQSSSSILEKPSKRHWDSDSSVEGDGIKFSELMKQQIKTKKIVKAKLK